jgi:hypothetical protein
VNTDGKDKVNQTTEGGGSLPTSTVPTSRGSGNTAHSIDPTRNNMIPQVSEKIAEPPSSMLGPIRPHASKNKNVKAAQISVSKEGARTPADDSSPTTSGYGPDKRGGDTPNVNESTERRDRRASLRGTRHRPNTSESLGSIPEEFDLDLDDVPTAPPQTFSTQVNQFDPSTISKMSRSASYPPLNGNETEIRIDNMADREGPLVASKLVHDWELSNFDLNPNHLRMPLRIIGKSMSTINSDDLKIFLKKAKIANLPIKVQQKNPKIKNSGKRYELYKSAKTVNEFYDIFESDIEEFDNPTLDLSNDVIRVWYLKRLPKFRFF